MRPMKSLDQAIPLETNPRPAALDHPTTNREQQALDRCPFNRRRHRIGEDRPKRPGMFVVHACIMS
jgi:hypothetical protein